MRVRQRRSKERNKKSFFPFSSASHKRYSDSFSSYQLPSLRIFMFFFVCARLKIEHHQERRARKGKERKKVYVCFVLRTLNMYVRRKRWWKSILPFRLFAADCEEKIVGENYFRLLAFESVIALRYSEIYRFWKLQLENFSLSFLRFSLPLFGNSADAWVSD